MTGRRRLRWIIARASRDLFALECIARGAVMRWTWPLRDAEQWWFWRRAFRAIRRGEWVVQA